MAIIDAKVRNGWPIEDKFVLGLGHIYDYCDTVFVISSHQALVSVYSKGFDRSIGF